MLAAAVAEPEQHMAVVQVLCVVALVVVQAYFPTPPFLVEVLQWVGRLRFCLLWLVLVEVLIVSDRVVLVVQTHFLVHRWAEQ